MTAPRLAWCGFLASLLLATATGCIPPSSDPVAVGEFCIGEPDCDGSALLDRDAVGRSRIDFAIFNTGSEAATVEVLALVPLSTAEASDAGETDAGFVGVEDRVVVGRSYMLEAGGDDADRFAATELGTRRTVQLTVRCDGCSARLEYVFETEPLECRDDEECSSEWLCNPALGRCAECLSDANCSPEQTCSESGRCFPTEVEAGCATARSAPPIGLLLLPLLILWRRRRRPSRAVMTAAFLLLLSASTPAFGAPPGAGFSLGAGPRWLTGKVGLVSERGIGIALGQELRWDYIGLGITLNWATFLTTQDPPPLSNNLQFFDFTIGPRGYLPIGDFEITLHADYKRVGLASNSLVRITGEEKGFHSFGGFVGTRWDGLGVELRLDTGVHQIFGLDSQLVTVELSVALTSGR